MHRDLLKHSIGSGKVLQPFTTTVWIALLFSMLFYHILKYLNKPISQYAKPFLQSARVVLTAVYGGLIYGQLLQSTTRLPFTSMEELSHLIHANQLSLALENDISPMNSAIFHGDYSAYKRIRLAHTTGRNSVVYTGTPHKLEQKILNNPRLVTFAFCEWALQHIMKPYKEKLMVITDEEAPLAWSGMPMRAGMPQSNALKWSMLRIDETGIFWKFFKKYEPNVDPPLGGNTHREPILKLTEFLAALLVLAYGYGPGIAVLLLEICWAGLSAVQDSVVTLISRK